jgi:predicted nuclease with RNAse H fold
MSAGTDDMETIGIDMAADPKRTAIAELDWQDHRATLRSLRVGVDDEDLLEHLNNPTAIGIDCPLGWPVRFVQLLAAHEAGAPQLVPSSRGKGWRREYVMRQTDLHVHARTGINPLSVAADKIAHPTIRLAALLSEADQTDLARDGSAALAEVYPAAALKVWRLPFRGYKGENKAATLGELVDEIQLAAPWLELGPHEAACRRSDDALDAVICALVARCVRLGRTDPPVDVETARKEGWIHLPLIGLEELA